ncbi:MAG: PHP domain-containing protein, partial [Gemmatimonadetes bacterium]|nr:PHP domain-containing protein [Gemmatimonadota bacterium]
MLIALLAVIPMQAQRSAAYEPLRAAIHVHSSYSTGDDSLHDIAEQARARGIDVLIFTDDDLLEVSYGLPPWRQLLRLSQSHRSLL